MFFKSKSVIGLDIGTSSIKVAEVSVNRGTATLEKFSIVETPSQGVAGADIVEVLPVAEAVRFACDEAHIKNKQTATALWGTSVIVKKITIPKMNENLIAEQIRWEAEQYIPFNINDVNLDFHILKQSSEGPDSMDLLLVAARKEQIMRYIEIIEGSGQQLSILDIAGFALANLFEFNYGKVSQTVGVLNIGAHYTNFIVIHNGETIFCRDVGVGGALYTNEIQKAMGITFVEAESLKLNASNGNTPEELGNVIQQTHESFTDEIQGSIDFFNNTTPGAAISKIYVTGGGSRIPGLIAALKDSCKLDCEYFDPLAKVKVSRSLGSNFKQQYGDLCAIVLGLGLRKLGGK